MASDKDSGSEQHPGDAPLPDTGEALPPMDFITFVLSLSTSALESMGENQGAGGERDLPLARQTIDLIGLLQEKTKGNLTGEEERLLDQVLYDLRLRYVDVASKHRPTR